MPLFVGFNFNVIQYVVFNCWCLCFLYVSFMSIDVYKYRTHVMIKHTLNHHEILNRVWNHIYDNIIEDDGSVWIIRAFFSSSMKSFTSPFYQFRY